MSLSTYYLEYGRHVVRLHRRRRGRRTRPGAIPLAMITMRKSIHRFPLLFYGYGAPLGGHRSSTKKMPSVMQSRTKRKVSGLLIIS